MPMSRRSNALAIRWWNAALFLMLAGGIGVALWALIRPSLRTDFTGNLVAEVYGMLATAVVAIVVFKRFRAEELAHELSSIQQPCQELTRLAESIFSDLNGNDQLSLHSLHAHRSQLGHLAQLAFMKAGLYAHHLSVEELSDIDRCATAAYEIAYLGAGDESAKSVYEAIYRLEAMYLYGASAAKQNHDQHLYKQMAAAAKKWLEKSVAAHG